jgi:hypothetical protein
MVARATPASALAAAVLGWALAGCDLITSSFLTNEFSGDEFPTSYDSADGAIVVGVREQGRESIRTAVLDVLSPLTIIDRGPGVAPSISHRDLTLHGRRDATGALDLPRAHFDGRRIVTLHPCSDERCAIGTPVAPRGFGAVLGMDLFAGGAVPGDALRLRTADQQLYILPDIAGSELDRARSCDAVFPAPFRGGGTLVIGGTETRFGSLRIAIDACLAPDPDRLLAQSARGTDALFVLSTALGISILNEAAYERYRQVDLAAPALATLPAHEVLLPSGVVAGRRGTIRSLALVANSTSTGRAPCRQMYAHHLLSARDCIVGDDCPCNDAVFCSVPAMVMLEPPDGLDVLVVPDANPTLQALRAELRPNRPEVDGILGTDALRAFELDIDHPHGRLIARCVDHAACTARPLLADRASRPTIDVCAR